MNYAKYELKNGNILKDGHTMFLTDVIRDLQRKSFLEEKLAASNKEYLQCSCIAGCEMCEDKQGDAPHIFQKRYKKFSRRKI